MSLLLPERSFSIDSIDGNPSIPKFPHIRAQLSAFARQYKPVDSYDSDAEGDEFGRAPSSLVNRVVALLDDEQEDELKQLLREIYGIDEETVRSYPPHI